MHATVSGCGDNLAQPTTHDAIEQARLVLSYLPGSWRQRPAGLRRPSRPARTSTADLVPMPESRPFDIHDGDRRRSSTTTRSSRSSRCSPASSSSGFARIDGTVGRHRRQQQRGDAAACCSSTAPTRRRASSGGATRSTSRCVYLADVPGFMIGSQVEREGIIRHGAKMITAVTEATVPQVSVVVRKAYGAGLYAMAGPGFGPDACLALPTARSR